VVRTPDSNLPAQYDAQPIRERCLIPVAQIMRVDDDRILAARADLDAWRAVQEFFGDLTRVLFDNVSIQDQVETDGPEAAVRDDFHFLERRDAFQPCQDDVVFLFVAVEPGVVVHR